MCNEMTEEEDRELEMLKEISEMQEENFRLICEKAEKDNEKERKDKMTTFKAGERYV